MWGLKIFSVMLLVVLAFLYLTSPSKIVVNNRGEIAGVVNKLREAVQREKFWIGQLEAAEIEVQEIKRQTIQKPEEAPKRVKRLQQLIELLPVLNEKFKTTR